MKYIIVSDLHLKYIEEKQEEQRITRIKEFLKSLIGKIDTLIFLGDTFDFWLEWKHVIIKRYFDVFYILRQIKESGCRLIFLKGNHDFLTGTFLSETIGFEIYDEYFTETTNGRKIFVSHGDLYIRRDFMLNIVKKIVKSFFFHKLICILHPNISLYLADKISNTNSGTSTKVPGKREMVRYNLYEKAKKLSNEYDIIIFGHSHIPEKKEINNSIYINCGDWINNNSYCYFDSDTIQILTYP